MQSNTNNVLRTASNYAKSVKNIDECIQTLCLYDSLLCEWQQSDNTSGRANRPHTQRRIASNTFSEALLSPKSTPIEKCLHKQIFQACFLLAPSRQYSTFSYFIPHSPFHSNQYEIHPSPGTSSPANVSHSVSLAGLYEYVCVFMYCIQQAHVQKRVFWVSRGPGDIHKTISRSLVNVF